MPGNFCTGVPLFGRVAEVRAKVAYGMNREMRISMAEIARHLGVGASAIAMGIRKEEPGNREITLMLLSNVPLTYALMQQDERGKRNRRLRRIRPCEEAADEAAQVFPTRPS